MPLTNPGPVVHQNLQMAIKQKQESTKPAAPRKGLLSSAKQADRSEQDDILNPSRRVASYVEMIMQKREEMKNGTA